MKLLGFYILKQKTLDERLAETRRKSIAVPNKMISALLRQIVGRDRTLMEAYREAQMILRKKMRNA